MTEPAANTADYSIHQKTVQFLTNHQQEKCMFWKPKKSFIICVTWTCLRLHSDGQGYHGALQQREKLMKNPECNVRHFLHQWRQMLQGYDGYRCWSSLSFLGFKCTFYRSRLGNEQTIIAKRCSTFGDFSSVILENCSKRNKEVCWWWVLFPNCCFCLWSWMFYDSINKGCGERHV